MSVHRFLLNFSTYLRPGRIVLGEWLLKRDSIIGNNSDLNEYKTMGIYRVSAESLVNTPANLGQYRGWMVVLGTGDTAYNWQIFCDTQSYLTYQRYATYNGAWSEWKVI